MSLYSFAAANLTTVDDRQRRPAVSRGQIARMLAFFLAAVAALVVMSQAQSRAAQSHAAEAHAAQAHAAEPQAAGFHDFVEGLWPQARRRGVSRGTFDRAFSGVAPDPEVIAKTHRQAEFVKPVGDYLAHAVSQTRIDTGRDRGSEYKVVLERADARYGVDPYVVLGVWGLESNFGQNTGDLGTIRCLATLAYARYRGDYFRHELLDALDILQAGHVAPDAMRGSWAGAMGQTQFMPSAFKRYAVDFSNHGRRDIWQDVPDALGSTANYLHRHGWIAGEPWGFEVVLPSPGSASMGGDGRAMRSYDAWAAAGVRRADGGALPRSGEAALLTPAGAGGPAFLVTGNFRVIKSYNNSNAYALGVALLGDRIAGGAPLRASWPHSVAQR